MLVRQVIQESGLPKALIAKDADISRSTLDSSVAGFRMPRGNSLRHRAEGLDKRADSRKPLAGRDQGSSLIGDG